MLKTKLKFELEIDDEGNAYINDILIDREVFEKVDCIIRDREQLIEDLCMWISESTSDNDKFLMKNDLKMLMDLRDDLVFSSLSTNDYIAQGLDIKEFNDLCEEILSKVEGV